MPPRGRNAGWHNRHSHCFIRIELRECNRPGMVAGLLVLLGAGAPR
jgi:hypothetical protein